MGLIDFVKEAGEKLFGKGQAQTAMAEVKADPDNAAKIQAANGAAGDAILDYINQATREKIVLCCGNVAGVAQVKDMMSVDQSEPEAQYYTVVSGDTLSKISKQYYSDPNKYMKIFEANKPMLSSPDKIYPGQKLRIPPA